MIVWRDVICNAIHIFQNMLRQLAPVMGGFGMKMMKKMGWDEGKPLGKAGVGHLEPLEMDVKVNRLGESIISAILWPILDFRFDNWCFIMCLTVSFVSFNPL